MILISFEMLVNVEDKYCSYKIVDTSVILSV